MGLKEILGIDKIQRALQIVQKNGGIRGTLKRRYLMDTNRAGTLVGEDQFGNKYYEDDSFFVPRNRYVIYPDRVWLDYDSSQIPPEWHRWLHHITNDTPIKSPPPTQKWVLPHAENLSIIEKEKYIPYSTTRTKIESWTPPKKN